MYHKYSAALYYYPNSLADGYIRIGGKYWDGLLNEILVDEIGINGLIFEWQ